ncbi:YhgE/Pip domain-containing protein [Bifidobacterium sp. MA2]|uniref:YhgE/Pip domain-containing protein n=1 Tax=Bifidobacterium santillanense TaxID=2809028 RepID=A0ABS5URA2_9BIFI|nr:YhgE/Pip domain-containing protein [Bifidobacterium santillanense]MBT1173336.1 YhgE/Pip domain-containing protein [Bifidobacterium santillanense]
MGNVLAILRRDLIRMLKVPAAWVIAFGLVFIPPLYAWFNIVGFWNPYGHTSGIQVVVANNDKGTDNQLIGKTNLGDQIVTQLKANNQLGWTFADESEALRRVESGKAYAAIVIPKDFSDAMAGVVTGGDRLQLEYYVNEKASAVAPKITDIGASTVDNQVNSTFVSTVSKVLSTTVNEAAATIGDKASGVQSDTLATLDEAQSDVAKARRTIAKLKTKLKDTPNKTKEARAALDDVQQVANTAGKGLAATSTLIGGMRSGIATLSTGASSALDAGSSLLSQASSTANAGIGMIAGGASIANGAAGQAIGNLQTVNGSTAEVLATLKSLNESVGLPSGVIDRLAAQNRQNAQTLKDLETLNGDTKQTVDSVTGLSNSLDTATQSTIDANTKARRAITTGAIPQLVSGLDTLATTTGTLAGGLTGQSSLIDQTKTVLDQLDTAAADTVKALDHTDKALAKVGTKLDTVSTDIEALDTSSLLSDLFGADGKLDADRIASFMLSPTVLDTKTLYPVNSYGSGMAPLFTNMALWVGAFALAVILKLETDDEGIENMTVTQGYLGRFALFSILAAAQGAVTTIGNLILGVQTVNAFAYVLTGVLTSLTYASIVYAFSTTFLHVGKGICVALIILQIPGASGLYPIEMMPDFFRNLYPYFPFTYSIDAFRETIGGFYGGHWFAKIAHLVVYWAIGMALGLLVRPLMANTNRLFARQIEESDMIIGEPVRMPGTEYRISSALRVLSDHDNYRAAIERKAARFAELYPKLKLGALIAGFAVPVALVVTFALTPNTKLEAMLAWLIWTLLIIAFLVAIEFIRDSLRRQTELGNLDDEAIRDYIHAREREKAKARARKREKLLARVAPPMPADVAARRAAGTPADGSATPEADASDAVNRGTNTPNIPTTDTQNGKDAR